MPRFHAISKQIVIALFSAIFLHPAFALAAEPQGWVELHSSHFTVITDAGEKRGREVALRFEQMRAVFAILLVKERLNQPKPLTILAFKNDQSYYQAAPLQNGQAIAVPGFFLSGEDQDFIILNMSEEEPWRAVARDFAAMLLNSNYPPAQGWFDEGLAEYFGSIRVDNRQVEIGGDPELHAATAVGSSAGQSDPTAPKPFTDLLNAQPWIPIAELFATKRDSAASQSTARTMYDAESWIVIHYLLHQQKLPETGAYFDLTLNKHVSVPDAIQQAFGASAEQFERAVKDYLKAQNAMLTAAHGTQPATPGVSVDPAYRFPPPVAPDDNTITSAPLPENDARALYAQIQVRIPERREAGLKELHRLATLVPLKAGDPRKTENVQTDARQDDPDKLLPTVVIGNEIAHRVLAWDHIQHGEFEEALPELSDAAVLNQRDLWIRFYLSVLKYRMAQAKHTETAGLANMMLDLKAVLEWYPEMADAYDLLALARNEGGGPTAAMQSERAAMNLSPRSERYVYHLAQIYIAGKKYEAADALLERLKNSNNPELATLVQEASDKTKTERKYGVPVGTTVAKPAPQKSPFDVLEEDAAKRAATEKTAQTGGPSDKRATKFAHGRLVDIDCSQAPTAILIVATGGSELKLRAANYKSLLLIGADDFSCAWQNREVTVNYKAGGTADGDLVSLEVR